MSKHITVDDTGWPPDEFPAYRLPNPACRKKLTENLVIRTTETTKLIRTPDDENKIVRTL